MLDADTKRKIDKARDILVGKVPDPKTQVEQITFALIYKFMDGMDQLSVDLGGQASFFANGYEQFAWSRLMDLRLGGSQRLDLYVRALEQMSANPHIPQLFRDIFKGAFLPYRDSETLNLFLKEMDGFNYTHSEDLGDAYEYLLSILGTQGRAGQFRTPRHIIDFIVRCVDPDKHETILDPACGTAGFLISAFKHIEEKYKDHPLSPDERKRLTENFTGYDISPDMVRLSLVNMYLHQFPNPTILEYDTLTTEDRWDDSFDVILANPPFMTPTGGIRPHNRFAVRANRSEVLFVDYIAEHLNPGGRAGIIVPEGIIFQSANAYKSLRKMLVDQFLVAVFSLPSGVFLPYSGVKTSILMLDKQLAHAKQNVLFSTITDVGFSLGAKRDIIEKNDLPTVLLDFQNFKNGFPVHSHLSWLVEKQAISKQGFSLAGERYRPVINEGMTNFLSIGEVCRITKGQYSSTKTEPGKYPLIVTAENQLTASTYQFDEDAVCVPLISSKGHGKADISRLHYAKGNFALANLLAALQPLDDKRLNIRYLFLILDAVKPKLAGLMRGAAHVSMQINDLKNFIIPVPPIKVQQEIVAEIEGYQKVIDGARMVVENYKPVIPIDPSWPLVKLGDVSEFQGGLWKSTKEPLREVLILRNTNFGKNGGLILTDVAKHFVDPKQLEKRTLQKGDILLENSGGGPRQPVGRVVFFDLDEQHYYSYSNFTTRIRVTEPDILPKFLFLILHNFYQSGGTEKIQSQTSGIRNLNKTAYKNIKIPLPNIEGQQEIILRIESEQRLIETNTSLVNLFEAKIAERIRRVWEGS